MESNRKSFGTLLHYFSWVMSLTFVLLGLWVVFYGRDHMKVSAFASTIWGLALVGYGLYRANQLYKKQRVNSHENISILLFALLFTSCNQSKPGKATDTATTGNIRIAVDESLRPLAQTEVEVFESIYRQAHIEVIYTSEKEAVENLLKDSVRCAMITRELAPEESESLVTQKISLRTVKVANDAIAVILHPLQKDTLLTLTQLRERMTNMTNAKNRFQFVFDHSQSGIVRYLKDSVLQSKECMNCFAVNSNPDVIHYVATHPTAIGFIGVEWITNSRDSTAGSFFSNIKVAHLKKSAPDEYRQPYQAYIAMKQYPLRRNVYIISREARTGLGSGFLSFVASDRGQRIILKSGLVPATMPLRIVEFKKEK